MEEILHQLIGSLSHYLGGLYIPGGAGFLPSTVCTAYLVKNRVINLTKAGNTSRRSTLLYLKKAWPRMAGFNKDIIMC